MTHTHHPWKGNIPLQRSIGKAIAIFSVCLLFLSTNLKAETSSYREIFKLDLSMNNVKVIDVLNQIEEQSDFYFLLNQSMIDVHRKVDINVEGKTIDDILDVLFPDTKVKREIHGKMIVLTTEKQTQTPTEIPQKKGKTIKGTILDQDGQPLPGASVIIEGTTSGTVSDMDGNYSIKNVPEDASLQFSFVGTVVQVIKVDGQSEISVRLMNDAIGLEEVVAVGYGVQKRSHITGSIASVDAEALNKAPATNTTSMLTGRMPGLYVKSTNGQPGDDEASFNIRGFGNALVIVDGVPRDFQQLDPNEIESVSILKDASAAVYGARAGNGVVLVTTKKGSRDSKPKISYTGNFSFQQPTVMHDMANASGYASYFKQAEELAGVGVDELTYSNEDIQKYRLGTEPGYEGADWQDIVFRDWAPQQQHNINVSGGTDKVNYFISAGALDQESMLSTGSGTYDRYNISSNVDVNLTDKLKVGMNLKWREEYRDDPVADEVGDNQYNMIFRWIVHAKPTVAPIPGEPDLMAKVGPLDENPLARARQDISGYSKDKRKQFDMILSADYELPIDGLSVNGKFYRKYYDRINRSMKKPWDVYTHDYNTGINTLAASNNKSKIEVTNWETNQVTTQLALNYNKEFENHAISAMVLGEYYYQDKYENGSSRADLISHDIGYLYSGNQTQTNYDIPEENGRKSFVSRLNYNYKQKYLIEFLFRADASIQFPEDSRWGYFPGVSLGWRMSEEDFFKNIDGLDYLKLRASYANLGYDDISNFDYLTGYELQNDNGDKYGFGDVMYQSSLRSIGLANSQITWEEMTTYNVGLDATFWNGLLGTEFDAFYRKRTGLLQDRMESIPSTFGADLPKENLGERDNRGFEFVLRHQNKIGDLHYSISGNVTWTREKYVYEEEREFDASDPDDARLNKKTGEWVNRMFGYRTDGFYDTQEEIDNDGITYPEFGEAQIGDIKYIDRDGDGEITYRDKEILGKGKNPEIFFGINTDIQYKNFDFSMLWQGAANYNVMFNGMVVAPNLSIGHVPYQYHVENAWSEDRAGSAKLPAPSLSGVNTHNDQNADIYLRDGKYIRLKTLSVGYTLPSNLTKQVNIDRVRLYFSGYNLWTIMPDDIFDFDPESEANSSLSTYPVQKVLTLGVNVTL